jgi:hypothetical protein
MACPNDEGGSVGAQPEYGAGDLFGRPHPPDRLLGDHPFPALGGVRRVFELEAQVAALEAELARERARHTDRRS